MRALHAVWTCTATVANCLPVSSASLCGIGVWLIRIIHRSAIDLLLLYCVCSTGGICMSTCAASLSLCVADIWNLHSNII